MKDSKIEWTDHTFNPWRGCTKVSAGCANCYAETLSGRNPKTLGIWGPSGTRVVALESMWREPLKWNREAAEAGERHRVFCASLADVFEDWTGLMSGPDGEPRYERDGRFVSEQIGGIPYPGESGIGMNTVRRRLFDLIAATPNLDWLLLTKRPENLKDMLPTFWQTHAMPPNVWLGTSVENQQAADERIPHLLSVPAAVRFLSCEPLLGPVDLRRFMRNMERDGADCDPNVDWVIVGGESGPGSRSMNLSWARGLVAQCKAAGVPVFVKQLGACPVATHFSDSKPSVPYDVPWTHRDKSADRCTGRQKPIVLAGFADKKGGDWNEWPSDLRVREFPKGGAS